MADKSSTISTTGEPLGSLTLSDTRKSWEFDTGSQASAEIQLIAIDPATGGAVDFKYALSQTGEEFIVPGGAGIKLTVYDGQILWVRQNVTAAPSLNAASVG